MYKRSSQSTKDSSALETWRHDVDFALDSTALDENELPAYSPAAENGALQQCSEDCCAFQELKRCLQESPAWQSVSLQLPRHKFLCWFALCRMSNPDIPNDVRRKCPFQWCDYVAQSNDGAEILNHITGCQHFCDGQYNCPYCHRPEAFMPAQRRSSLSRLTKRHFLRSAFAAIYRLGSKGLQKAMHPAKLNVMHHDRRQSKKRRHEDDFPMLAGPAENEKLSCPPPEIELDSRAIVPSVPVPTSSVSAVELPNRRSLYYEMEGILGGVPELASKRFSAASSESALITNISPSSTSSPISPVTSEQWFFSQDFDSPISPAEDTNSFQWPLSDRKDPISSNSETSFEESMSFGIDQSTSYDSLQTRNLRPSVAMRSFPNIRIDTSCGNTRSIDTLRTRPENHLREIPSPLQIEAKTQSPVKLVEELRGLFNTNVKVSRAKLIQPPVSIGRLSVFENYGSAADMFESAWRAVAMVVQGRLPKSFADVFALAHLGYSCALATQEIDLTEQFHSIFTDLTHWSFAIASGQDRIHYMTVIQKLFSPHATVDGPCVFEDSLDTENPLLTPTPQNRFSPGRSRSFPTWPSEFSDFESTGYLHVPHTDQNNYKQLYDLLKNGITIQLCVQYLDLFEHLSTKWNNSQYRQPDSGDLYALPIESPSTENTSMLRQNVIDQLMAIRGVDSFRPIVDKAAVLLSTTSSMSLRNLELYLVHEGRIFAQNQSMYRKFVDTVTLICERASTSVSSGRRSRNEHLLKDIEGILMTHSRLLASGCTDAHNTTSRMMFATVPNVAVQAPMDVGQGPTQSMMGLGYHWWTDTPTSASSASPSINDPGNFTFNLSNDSTLDGQASRGVDDATFDYPIDVALGNQDVSVPTATEGTMTCEICGKLLQGKLIYLQSNMRRHMRELHKPDAKKLICTMGGCGRAFARNHNLLQHQRAVHQVQIHADHRTNDTAQGR